LTYEVALGYCYEQTIEPHLGYSATSQSHRIHITNTSNTQHGRRTTRCKSSRVIPQEGIHPPKRMPIADEPVCTVVASRASTYKPSLSHRLQDHRLWRIRIVRCTPSPCSYHSNQANTLATIASAKPSLPKQRHPSSPSNSSTKTMPSASAACAPSKSSSSSRCTSAWASTPTS
jgi:hypothetical protein